MTYDFAAQGRTSKAWFLQRINRLGAKETLGLIHKQLGSADFTYEDFKRAVATLVEQGYVEDFQLQGRILHRLTYDGVEYLGAHQQELIGPPSVSDKDAPRHTVPPLTGDVGHLKPTPGPEELPREDWPHTEHVIGLGGGLVKSVAPKVPEPSVEESSTSTPPAPTPSDAAIKKSVHKAPAAPRHRFTPDPEPKLTARQQAKSLLLDMLYEKYGDTITAKELIEALPEDAS